MVDGDRVIVGGGGQTIMTVVIALTGLLLMPFNVGAALSLLPSVLRLIGDGVHRLRMPWVSRTVYRKGGGRFWYRVSKGVMRAPVVSVVLATGILLLLALPYLRMEIGTNFIESLPDDSDTVHAFTVVNEQFEVGVIATSVVVEADPGRSDIQDAVAALTRPLGEDPAYGGITVTAAPDGGATMIEVVTKLDRSTTEARAAIEDLRSSIIPEAFAGVDAEPLATGTAAFVTDFVDALNSRTALIFVWVLGLSFMLLMIVFRSLVVPLKAIVMNLLSVGAAYGMLVLVFQEGVGADLFGFKQTDVIEAWIPIFLFAVLFGLSMDYHICLLSRIKEHYDITGDNPGSGAFGLASTGAIITGAALIMVAVFGGFAAGDMVMFQQIGFGLAVAVILDATIVRSILVPAAMKLLGDKNWYLPGWLQWLRQIHIKGEPEPRPQTDEVNGYATGLNQGYAGRTAVS